MSVLRRLSTRLMDAGVEPEVTHELLRRGEALNIADRSQNPDRHRCVHSGDRQQASQLHVIEDGEPKGTLDHLEILTQPIEFPQPLFHGEPLIHRQWLLGQPGAAPLAEEIGGRTTRDQVRREHRMNLVLQTGALAHDLCTASDLSPECLRAFIRNPHFRQKIAGVELRKYGGIDFVRLHMRFGDQPDLQRVRDDHALYVRLQDCNDSSRIAGCLEHDVIIGTELAGEADERSLIQRNTTSRSNSSILEIGNLGHGARDIKTYHSHVSLPIYE
jgi:hypothetical protein